ncbi:MAG: nucleotidyltransferase domain-containing protein [Candidatus Spyradocola sp.]|jgi:predicted nucleotidyltransferase
MVDLDAYLTELLARLREAFGPRLLYAGLQGSHLRGEAGPDSDIDVMLVIDGLSYDDLLTYRSLLQACGEYERSCGFVCGREDLRLWNPLEIYHLLHSTQDLVGELAVLVPPYARADAVKYLQLSADNLFHELCHRTVHGRADRASAALPGLCKSAFFLLQDLHSLETGDFAPNRASLRALLSGTDRAVWELDAALRRGESPDAEAAYRLLFAFCREVRRRAAALLSRA